MRKPQLAKKIEESVFQHRGFTVTDRVSDTDREIVIERKTWPHKITVHFVQSVCSDIAENVLCGITHSILDHDAEIAMHERQALARIQ